MGAYKLNGASTWARLGLRAVQKPKIETEYFRSRELR